MELAIAELQTQLTKLAELAGNQQSALARLDEAFSDAEMSAPQAKSLREVTMYGTMLGTLREQFDGAVSPLTQAARQLQEGSGPEVAEHHQLFALAESAELINSSLDLDAVLNQVMDLIINLTGAERGFLMLQNPETGRLNFKVARNLDRETLSGSSFEISRTIVRSVARDGEAVVTTDAQDDPRFQDQKSVAAFNLRSILCVPLKVKDKLTGVIYADNRIRSGIFTPKDRDLLQAFANQAAVAIENARLFADVTGAKALMDNVFASITSGLITTDENERVRLFNPAAERILGLSAAQCLSQPYREALAVMGDGLWPIVDTVDKGGQVVVAHELEPRLPERDGVTLSVSVAPLRLEGGSGGLAIVFDDLTDKKRLEHEREMVKRYLPGELLDSFATLDELRLGGSREDVSIVFADIRGFTSFSERMDPHDVVETINRYFGLAYEAIHANGGIVDKYMGDAVMAHFNTPLRPQPDHAWLAVKTAWEARQSLDDYLQAEGGDVSLHFGIGVNTGGAVAGNVGARDRMEYTLMGDAVNLAKRLQENAKPRQIILSHSTYELVKDRVEVEPLEPLQVKGRSAVEQVYEVKRLK